MKKKRILVVEDDRTSRKILVRILESAGYDVVESGEGKDAIHIAEMCPPTAMVVDVMLPDMRGTELIQQLRANPDCKYVRSVFLTGILSKRTGPPSFYFDIDGIRYPALPKPVRKEHLLGILELAERASAAAREKDAKDAQSGPRVSALAKLASQHERSALSQREGEETLSTIEAFDRSPLW